MLSRVRTPAPEFFLGRIWVSGGMKEVLENYQRMTADRIQIDFKKGFFLLPFIVGDSNG